MLKWFGMMNLLLCTKHADNASLDMIVMNVVKLTGFMVGQNFYLGMNYEPPKKQAWDMVMKSFYDEVSMFQRSYIKPYVFGSYGHFTQVVWAATWKVGCGYVLYKEGEYYNSFFVCNYGPTGNWFDGENVQSRQNLLSLSRRFPAVVLSAAKNIM
uniref:U52-Eretoxin-Ek1a_1 n=1 Tax=Eresus cinnaberinus TaxID=175337 RepID=A0A2D0PC66_ERECI